MAAPHKDSICSILYFIQSLIMVVSSTERNLYVSMLRQGKSASQILDILNAITSGFNTDVLEDNESQEVVENVQVQAVAV